MHANALRQQCGGTLADDHARITGNLILMTLICIVIFWMFMALRPANAGMQGNLPTPVQALPKYPPVVCVAPNWAITPCRDRQPQVPQPVSDHKLPPYPPVVCVTPELIPEPCAERKWGWQKGARITASRYYSSADGCLDDCWIISITGTIWWGDAAKFKRIIEENNITKAIVDLSSSGGGMVEALSIGYQVRDRGFSTRTIDLCTSACAFIWLAGHERILIGNVGFHTVSVRDKDGILHADPGGNATVRAYYKTLGISETASYWLTSPGPDETIWMDERLAADLGIKINMQQPKLPMMTTRGDAMKNYRAIWN